MVTNTLTDQIIKAGKSLIKELEESGTKVDSALWFNYPEEGSWKLMLSFSNIEEEGPKAAYKKVQKALSNVQEKDMIFLDDIAIVEPNTRLIQSLKRAFNKCKDITISNSVIDGQLISGAYIYTL